MKQDGDKDEHDHFEDDGELTEEQLKQEQLDEKRFDEEELSLTDNKSKVLNEKWSDEEELENRTVEIKAFLEKDFRGEIEQIFLDWEQKFNNNDYEECKTIIKTSFSNLDKYDKKDISSCLNRLIQKTHDEPPKLLSVINYRFDILKLVAGELEKRNYYENTEIKLGMDELYDQIIKYQACKHFEERHFPEALELFRKIKNRKFKDFRLSFLSYLFNKKPEYLNEDYIYGESDVSLYFLKGKLDDFFSSSILDSISGRKIYQYSANHLLRSGQYKGIVISDIRVPIDYIFRCIIKISSFSMSYDFLEKVIAKTPKLFENIAIDLAIYKNELSYESELLQELEGMYRCEEEEEREFYNNELLDLLSGGDINPDEFDGNWDDLYTSKGLD